MSTVSGGPRPDDFDDDDVLTAELFKQATGFWVADDVPSDGEGKDGDVVFVLKEEELGGNCPECPEPELPGLGGWAEITDVSGSPKRYAYPDPANPEWVAFEWTGDGELTTTAGLADTLLVGGGAGHHNVGINVKGDSGDVVYGTHQITSGSVTVGQAGRSLNAFGGASSIGSLKTRQSAWGRAHSHSYNPDVGFESDITGVMNYYAADRQSQSVAGGGTSSPTVDDAQNGIVIVRVPAAQAEKVPSGSWVTRSNHFAVVENGVVTETYTEHHYGNGTITPLPQTDLIPCDANVTEGYSYENGEFVAPVPEIPAAQQEILDRINELQKDLEELTK